MRACTRTVDEMGVRIDELENSIGELMAQVRPCPQPGTSFFSCPTSHHPALLTCSCARVLHDRRRASTRSRYPKAGHPHPLAVKSSAHPQRPLHKQPHNDDAMCSTSARLHVS